MGNDPVGERGLRGRARGEGLHGGVGSGLSRPGLAGAGSREEPSASSSRAPPRGLAWAGVRARRRSSGRLWEKVIRSRGFVPRLPLPSASVQVPLCRRLPRAVPERRLRCVL